jgi:uncharacterized protein YbjT (DUF2867 family)
MGTDQDNMILVTGATGNIGGATLEALVAGGRQVRALSRSERSWPEGVEGVTGDLDDADSLVRAAEGVEAAFLLSGYTGTERLLAALEAAGATRAVLLSSSSAPSGDMTNAVAKYHIEAERTVQGSGLEWTVLQPNSFMANALQWAPQLAEGDDAFFSFFVGGLVDESTVLPAVPELLGRSPRTFEAWARANAEAFAR